ncbi:MAG: TlpA disulfide reductase family protein [Bacteroidia bacterium]|nr:TlpA disulfide reductase family protein [Bacteroidia bacterium]
MKRFGGVLVGVLLGQALLGQSVQVLKYEALADTLAHSQARVLVVNFWATWCKPCLAELPHFARVVSANESKGVAGLFVTLDWAENLETAVKPYLAKKPLPGTVVLLDEVDGNRWLGKVAEAWTGAIPATAFYGPGGTLLKFHEGALTEAELEQIVAELLAP